MRAPCWRQKRTPPETAGRGARRRIVRSGGRVLQVADGEIEMSIKVRRAAGAALILAACAAGGAGWLRFGSAPAPVSGRSPAARLAIEMARHTIEEAWRAQR